MFTWLAGVVWLGGLASSAFAQSDTPRDTRPRWSKDELKTLFTRVQGAARAPSVQAQNEAMGNIAGLAYRVERRASESLEAYARRTLRTREPDHPAVKKGQWLSALTRRFYLDASVRFAHLAKFELSGRDRRYLEKMAGETKRYAAIIAQSLELILEGLEGVVEPLPAVDGEPPERRGAMVRIHGGGKITIEGLDRVKFEDHQPPSERARTGKGALRELFSAQRQYNVSAEMLGRYDRAWKRNRGHVQVVLPAAYPALYLNEVVRGGKQAGMHTLHVMTMSKRGELRELRIRLSPKKAWKKKKLEPTVVRCADEETAELCAKRIRHATVRGAAYFAVD